ncbi:OpgC domain-containing protein [Catenovulum sp. SM1970]|uniref:OpgC domain-containing protein n=1 Tax=Marinifaba aquimaris TaxID=2741323 RepID=UPI0015718459|nr:OpgC domain-containing protein [Marinifaba aquimaris]NTS75739.1 OpgC domain-containing protein [Marinifaba aquimaris]
MSRVLALDGLRGWLLIIIACNHLFGQFVSTFTREPFGFVSAAEGFVFLSGFVAYLVYSKIDDKAKQRKKIWHRCGVIYLFHCISLLIVYCLIALWPVFKPVWLEFLLVSNWYQDPTSTVFLIFSLLEQPGFFDILILYLWPMFFLPFALQLLAKGKWLLLLGASFAVWLAAQFLQQDILNQPFSLFFPDLTLRLSYFDPLAWQVLFYLGVVLAYLIKTRPQVFVFPPIIKAIFIAVFASLMLIKHMQPEWFTTFASAESRKWLTGSNDTVPVLRIINILVLAYMFKLSLPYLNKLYELRYPVFLGQHALAVFVFHTMVIYYLGPSVHQYVNETWYWDVLACMGFVALLSIPAYLDSRYKIWRKQQKLNLSVST